MRVGHRIAAGWVLAGSVLSSGCVTAKYVSGISSGDGHVKFLYHQRSLFEAKQGVVVCKADKDGELSDCVDHPVIFKD